MTDWQNNIVQTAGTSASQTAFMCGVLAAFEMLRASKVVAFHINPTPVQTFVWLSCASLLGVLLAVPMRRHFIVPTQCALPFRRHGMAAASRKTLIGAADLRREASGQGRSGVAVTARRAAHGAGRRAAGSPAC